MSASIIESGDFSPYKHLGEKYDKDLKKLELDKNEATDGKGCRFTISRPDRLRSVGKGKRNDKFASTPSNL